MSRAATPDDKTIGARVRMKRISLGMSQEMLADYLGLTFQQVQKYEIGKNRIAASRLIGIASALGCSIDELIGGIGATSNQAADDLLRTPNGQALALAFRSIESPALQLAAIEAVRAIAKGAGAADTAAKKRS
jgi:transcriptional regulator with XRE-family HTH domain